MPLNKATYTKEYKSSIICDLPQCHAACQLSNTSFRADKFNKLKVIGKKTLVKVRNSKKPEIYAGVERVDIHNNIALTLGLKKFSPH